MGPRTVVVFQSDAFNTTEEKDYVINPGCFGDDLGRWLLERLAARGIQVDPEPGAEDFGWYIGFTLHGVDYHLVIGLRPGSADAARAYLGDAAQAEDLPPDEPDEWICTVERNCGLFGSLLGGRNRGIEPAACELIHSVLSEAPRVTDISWHSPGDFRAGNEALGASHPQG